MTDSGIYGLRDPRSHRIVYVGRAFDVEHRFGEHMKDGVSEAFIALQRDWLDYPVIRTKRNCLAYFYLEGVPLELVMIEDCPADRDAQDRSERRWAEILVGSGHPISNGDSASTRLSGQLDNHKRSCPYTATLEIGKAGDFPNGWRRFSSKHVIPLASLPNWGRLERERSDLAALVRARRLSPHRAMVEAGFAEKAITIPANPTSAGRRLAKHFTPEQFLELTDAYRAARGV